uniref:Amidase domain-containing protein n=1 Tax=Panagrolaimus sp. JU765 TaxID=591449 RepID=A0AC34RPJ0_9BILA
MLPRIVYKIFFYFYFKIVGLVFQILNYCKRKDSVEKPEDVLVLISATDAAEMIRTREITSFDLVSAYVERIKVVDPMLNAVVSNNFEEALRLAEQVDVYLDKLDKNSEEYLDLKNTKPLLGVPFTAKETYAVAGFAWAAGVYVRKDKFAIEDAELVKRVKDSGAILLAITNVPEAAMWFETNNQIYGRTNNPYDLRRAVGGSSGGEAALIAAAGSVFGLGSDIGGSIRIPAIFNGVFGLKTTELTVPMGGQYPRVDPGSYKERMLSLGPICRYAKDLPLLLKVFVGEETANGPMKLNQPVSLRKTRFFYMEELHSLE